MNYFDDLNSYLVRQETTEENNMEPAPPTGPSYNPNPGFVPESYIGNIIKLNIGKLGTFFFTFSDSEKWRDESFVGVIEEAGRDYFIIRDMDSNDTILLPLVYFLWARFKGEITLHTPSQPRIDM